MTELIKSLETVALAASVIFNQNEEEDLHLETSYVLNCVLSALDALGYQIVPKVATTGMIREGWCNGQYGSMEDVYRAMLSAAPKVRE